jgi:hypothetical protein
MPNSHCRCPGHPWSTAFVAFAIYRSPAQIWSTCGTTRSRCTGKGGDEGSDKKHVETRTPLTAAHSPPPGSIEADIGIAHVICLSEPYTVISATSRLAVSHSTSTLATTTIVPSREPLLRQRLFRKRHGGTCGARFILPLGSTQEDNIGIRPYNATILHVHARSSTGGAEGIGVASEEYRGARCIYYIRRETERGKETRGRY